MCERGGGGGLRGRTDRMRKEQKGRGMGRDEGQGGREGGREGRREVETRRVEEAVRGEGRREGGGRENSDLIQVGVNVPVFLCDSSKKEPSESGRAAGRAPAAMPVPCTNCTGFVFRNFSEDTI